jgi:two-component system, NtrC family, sensor kinase
MRRHSRAGGKSLKARRRKAATPTRRKAPKALRRRSTVAAGDGIKTAQLARERNEALEQLSAASEVLNVINSSPGDLQAVFAVILASATRICQAKFGTLYRFDGEKLHFAAEVGAPRDLAEFYKQREPHLPPPGSHIERVVRTKLPGQTADYTADAVPGPAARFARAGSTVWVPMLKNDVLVGVILVYRQEIRLFTDRQIALLQNFAAQAVIAIENARLLNELKQRTADLTELLKQQTATSEVLGVISSSPGELEPVFKTILENATRLCGAKFGTLYLRDGDSFRFGADIGTPRRLASFVRQRGPFQPRAGTRLDEVIRTKRLNHTPDLAVVAVPDVSATLGGARSSIMVPMLKDDALIGIISIYRQEVRPFTDKQIALVKNFAAQAVIAIENARLLNELRESLEQQTATADVLSVISKSPGDLERVFQSILENATRLCEAKFGNIFQFFGNAFHFGARVGTPRELAEFQARRGPFLPVEGGSMDRMMRTKQAVHVVDNAAEPVPTPAARLGGARSTVDVPMIKDGALVGAIAVYRQEVRPFTNKQIELVQNFAAQAVIAIENARLLSELRQRTADLTESLEQQTATSEVLRVISSSPGELEPVFNAMLENAVRICDAKFGNLSLADGNALRIVAMHGAPRALEEYRRREPTIRHGPMAHIFQTKSIVAVADLAAEERYSNSAVATLGGARTFIGVPMLKDGEVVGAITVYRQEVRPFSEKQTALLQNFASQAVIAIENTRLLNELRESLQQQTATSKVLQVISSSPGELEPVFESVLANAVKICESKFGVLHLYEDDLFFPAVQFDVPSELVKFLQKRGPFRPRPGTNLDKMLQTNDVVRVTDDSTEAVPGAAGRLGIARSLVTVPMLKDNAPIGAIIIYRTEVRPFTDKQVELLRNFAAQAVIAIENTRLLNELRQSLDQQTATADVLRVISSSPGELEPVFQAMLENATRICDAKFGNIYRWDGESLHLAGSYNTPAALIAARRRDPPSPPAGTPLGDMITTKRTVHGDLSATRAYAERHPSVVGAVDLGGVRTEVAVPLLKNDKLIGAFVIYRQEARPFTDKQIELVTNFAAQAVIAIDNARLLNELRQRTTDLSKSLEDLRTAQDRLVQTEKLVSLGQLTAGIAHEIKNPLNFVNNFSSVSVELIDELRQALGGVHLDSKQRAEIAEIADTLQGNLEKVVQHGKRADTIVKNMLLHSRQGSGEHRPVDVNALVEESLSLAYHGARAEKQGFEITLTRSFDPAAGEADLFPQEITRALLNLISNGFYATTKRKAEADGGNYEPTLAAATKDLGNRVEIRIRDNGTGIPSEVKEKLFSPFFTTKPAGEGTGLGLSISHDIIVKQHGGSIEVDTRPGEFTEFRVILPRTGTSLIKPGERANH